MQAINLTSNAVNYLQKALEGKSDIIGIRLGVKNSGCSGLSYIIDFAKELKEEDQFIETEGVPFVIDLQSFEVLQGVEIDCVFEGLGGEVLKFNNPNVKSTCGCGESFSVEK